MTAPPTRSQQLVHDADDLLKQARGVRLLTEMGAGTVPPEVFAAYLQIEHDFVLTACRLHGMAVWNAPSAETVRAHSAALQHLSTDQERYFADAVAAWPVPGRLTAAGRNQAETLHTCALDAAGSGGYAAVVTCLFAAEHLYRTWCAAAAAAGLPTGPVGDWIRLHTAEPFLQGVDSLATEVDSLPEGLEQRTVHQWFTDMLRAEIAFHDAAYLLPGPR